jgi:hypothetical protein
MPIRARIFENSIMNSEMKIMKAVNLLQDGRELEDSKGAAHFQLREVAVQPAEDAGVFTADEEDLV